MTHPTEAKSEERRFFRRAVENAYPIRDPKKERVPEGTKWCGGLYLTPKGELVLTDGSPSEDGDHHCDEMGCSSVSHVIARIFPTPETMADPTEAGERERQIERAFLALARWHRDHWPDTDATYWLHRLMQEVGELAGVMAGDHDDSMECEALQVASIALNMVARFGHRSEIRHELVRRLHMTPNEAADLLRTEPGGEADLPRLWYLAAEFVNTLHFGRAYCGQCEAYDEDCGCTPNVNERRAEETTRRLAQYLREDVLSRPTTPVEPDREHENKRLEAYDRALNRIAGLGMDAPPQMEREDFHRDQLQAAIGLAARTVQSVGG